MVTRMLKSSRLAENDRWTVEWIGYPAGAMALPSGSKMHCVMVRQANLRSGRM
jgi:hypothetical protein